MEKPKEFNMSCPIPIKNYLYVTLAHGGGGKLMRELIEKMIAPALNNPLLDTEHDSTVFDSPGKKLAFTTDSYVVKPLFFPGGNIGDLAVYGTVNDLAMSGAKPLYLSLGFILEEGLEMKALWEILKSIKSAAIRANVQIITGDTKVVDKGKGDGIFINTSGVGVIEHSQTISPAKIKAGDKIILNGDIGRHGIAIMAVREGLKFESEIKTDSAPLNGIVNNLIEGGVKINCMRDLTRGGLSSALNELSESSNLKIQIDENAIPVNEDVHGACEILGLDPLYVANEGRFIVILPEGEVDSALEIMHSHELGRDACVIGEIGDYPEKIVTMKNKVGTYRIIDMLSGEQLPRIC